MASLLNASTTGLGGLISTGDNSGALALQTGGTTALTVTSAQNVGIGTTSPTTLVDLVRSSTSGSDVSMPNLFVRNTSATQGNGGTSFNQAVVSVSAGNGTVFGGIRATYDSAGSYGTGMQLYANSTNPLQFYTNGSEAMRITSAGNLGIGTSSPSKKLVVTTGTAQDSIVLNNTALTFTTATSRIEVISGPYANDFGTGMQVGIEGGASSAYDHTYLQFYTSSYPTSRAVRMHISEAGNIGIGTTAPYNSLQVAGIIKTATTNQSGTIAFGGNTQSSAQLGIFRGDANSTADGNWLNIAGYSGITFSASAANIGSQTEAMRIDSSGRVGIGVVPSTTGCGLFVQYSGTYTFAINNGTYTWYQGTSSNNMSFYSGEGTLRGYLTLAGSFTNTSDVSLKENIVDLTYGLPEILQLKPRNYNVKGYEPKQIGFIAQEVQSILPELVDENNGLLGLSYGNMTAVLTKAIQELSAQLTELKAEVATLKGV